MGDGESGYVDPYVDPVLARWLADESGYVAPNPSLAKWVALTGGIVCAALALSLPLLQLVTP